MRSGGTVRLSNAERVRRNRPVTQRHPVRWPPVPAHQTRMIGRHTIRSRSDNLRNRLTANLTDETVVRVQIDHRTRYVTATVIREPMTRHQRTTRNERSPRDSQP